MSARMPRNPSAATGKASRAMPDTWRGAGPFPLRFGQAEAGPPTPGDMLDDAPIFRRQRTARSGQNSYTTVCR
jgi:hypothetical protein